MYIQISLDTLILCFYLQYLHQLLFSIISISKPLPKNNNPILDTPEEIQTTKKILSKKPKV